MKGEYYLHNVNCVVLQLSIYVTAAVHYCNGPNLFAAFSRVS